MRSALIPPLFSKSPAGTRRACILGTALDPSHRPCSVLFPHLLLWSSLNKKQEAPSGPSPEKAARCCIPPQRPASVAAFPDSLAVFLLMNLILVKLLSAIGFYAGLLPVNRFSGGVRFFGYRFVRCPPAILPGFVLFPHPTPRPKTLFPPVFWIRRQDFAISLWPSLKLVLAASPAVSNFFPSPFFLPPSFGWMIICAFVTSPVIDIPGPLSRKFHQMHYPLPDFPGHRTPLFFFLPACVERIFPVDGVVPF